MKVEAPEPESNPLSNSTLLNQERNQFMKLGDSQLLAYVPQVKVEKKVEPEIDYRSPEYIEYFGKKEVKTDEYQSIVNNLVDSCRLKVKKRIRKGQASISPDTKDLADVLAKDVNIKQQPQQKELHRSRMVTISPPPDHKNFVERMNKARKQNEEKRRLKLHYQESKKQAILKKSLQAKKKSQEQQKVEKQKSIKNKMQEIQKKRQQEKQQRRESYKRYKSVLSEKRRHELMAQKYENKVLQPMLEERDKILKERSKRFKGYSIDEIRLFEQECIRKEEQKASGSRKVNEDWEYNAPPIIPRIYQLLEEEKVKQRIQLEQKKRALQQKVSRQQYYAQYLRETVSVKIDSKKKLQMQRLNYKPPINRKSHSQRSTLGNNYLAEIKTKIKKQSKDKDSYSMQQQPAKKIVPQQNLKANTSMGHYNYQKTFIDVHEKRVNRLLSSNTMPRSQKLKQLRLQVDKLNERASRKMQMSKVTPQPQDSDADLSVLLSSIKAKIGIMHLYKP